MSSLAAACAADLRGRVFRPDPPGRPPRIGAEVEAIPVGADDGRPVPIRDPGELSSLPLLRRFGARAGWREEPSPYGVPRFVTADGGIVSYEPGGQVELSAAPMPSVDALVASLRGTMLPLERFLGDHGVRLLHLGLEPNGRVADLPLQLPGERYVRMTRFMEEIGTGGTRMMRQTASVQVALDWGADPLPRWRLLNAAAPLVTAIFASSPLREGRPTGERSARAGIWRALDGGRSGLLPCDGDPVEEYLAWAMRAPAIAARTPDGGYPSFAEWIGAGAGLDAWRTHLTTLFPEARPRGFVEVRSPDAVAPEWYAAPLVLLSGLLYDSTALAEAADVAGDPDPARLVRAGRDGLSDPEIGAAARDLWDVALRGAEALGPGWASRGMLEEARAFRDRYTRRGRCPADDVLDAVPAATAVA